MNKEKMFKDALAELISFKKPSVPFELNELIDDDIFESKIRGTPYWEEGVEFPKNTLGEPMQMMAQINLSKMPELPYLPKEGILQFFISNGDAYGINFNKAIDPKYNRVIYWANPDMDKYAPYPVEEYAEWPANVPLSIEPQEVKEESCGICDSYNMDQIIKNKVKPKFPKLDEQEFVMDFLLEEEEYTDKVGNEGSKMGGYAAFTQDDPRGYDNKTLYNVWGCKREDDKEIIVLLQLDSDHEEMMWGDCGVANWHILREDLEKLDFSRVFYTWDCC